MPVGDPAAYDPNVVKSRLKRGQPAYQPRGKRGISLAQRRETEAALERQAGAKARVPANARRGGQRSFQPVSPARSPQAQLRGAVARTQKADHGYVSRAKRKAI